MTPKPGEYLETQYLDVLRETQSPFAAAHFDMEAGVPQMASIARNKNNGFEISLTFNWHDGNRLLTLDAAGHPDFNKAWNNIQSASFHVDDPQHLTLAAPGEPVRSYVWVGDAARFVANQVLAGQYRDERGQIYEFGTDGAARFPSESGTYNLMMDQVFDFFDSFRMGETGRYIAYRRNGNQLTLYPITADNGPGEGLPDYTHPIARLQRSR
ncbi:MAG TPA: hypothetical protein VL574_11320 [Stellaceae bacterium]|nr:hypothetical protein [Stellaceae bacterium]